MRKRVLSLLLAICLVVGLLPPTTLAAEGGTPPASTGHEAITVTIGGVVVFDGLTEGVHYKKVASTGAVTDGTEGDHNLKLDYSEAVPELTLKGVTIEWKTAEVHAMVISGEGALKIIVDGNSSIKTTKKLSHVISLSMVKGTTITSKDNSNLRLENTYSGNQYNLLVNTGDLTLENANLTSVSLYQTGGYAYGAIQVAAGNLNIKGGTVDVQVGGTASGIVVGGEKLEISNGANVTVTKAFTAPGKPARHIYGIKAGTLKLTGGKLTVSDAADYMFKNYNSTDWHSLLIGAAGSKTSKFAESTVDLSTMEGDSMKVTLSDSADITDPATPRTTLEGTGDEVKASIADLKDGEGNAKALSSYRYISFEYVCGAHDYGSDPTNTNCLKCGGGTRAVAKPITMTVGDSINWSVGPNKTCYATTDADGNIADITTTYVDDATTPWNIKLDNTQAVAELTLKGATIKSTTEISGEGELKITVAEDSSVMTSGKHILILDMEEGTTITGSSQLTVELTKAGNYYCFQVLRGGLTLDHANLSVLSKNSHYAAYPAMTVAGDMDIKGGAFAVTAGGTMGAGIKISGNLNILDGANVTVAKTSDGSLAAPRNTLYGISATAINFSNGKLTVSDAAPYQYGKYKGQADGALLYSLPLYKAGSSPVECLIPTLAAPVEGDRIDIKLDGVLYQGNLADVANLGECRTISFEYVCGNHAYDDDVTTADPCQKCGAVGEVPKDVIIRIITDGGVTQTSPLTGDYDRNLTVPAGKIYYGFTNENGLVTDFKEYDTEPTGWTFKLDNYNPVAELVFNNAYLRKKEAYKDAGEITSLIAVSGKGALRIVAQGETTLEAVGSVISTAMVGGTTYTSKDGGKLLVNQSGTSNKPTLIETAGSLTFKQANLYLNSSNQNVNYPFIFIYATSDMQVNGGKLDMTATSYSANGIRVGGNLTLDNLAIVNIRQACISANTYTGLSKGNSRYGVHVGGIFKVDDASLYIIDNTKNMFEYSVNKMPNLGDNTVAYYSANVDGSDANVLNPDDRDAQIEYTYVSFAFNCNGNHIYEGGATDPDCDVCGLIRKVPKDVTIRIITDGGEEQTAPLTGDYDRKVTVAASKTYYGFANADGLVTEFKEYDAEPTGWAFKLDNTDAVAKLVFNNAYLRKSEPYDEPVNGKNRITSLMTITGEGELEIVAQGETTLRVIGSAIATAMTGGTTYTSEDGGKLIVNQAGTSNPATLTETAGKLTFNQANLYLNSSSQNVNYPFTFINANSDMQVSGGKLEMVATGYSAKGIYVGGNLTLDQLAIVNIKQACTSVDSYTGVSGRPTSPNYRYGVHVGGIFKINDASLHIYDNAKNMFEYSVNKMPERGEKTKAQYSENIDGTGLKVLNPNNPDAQVDYPYVSFTFDCESYGGHAFDNASDPDCNVCGFTQAVPKDVTIHIFTDGGVKLSAPYSEDNHRKVTVPAGKIYYGFTTANGLVTEFKAYNTEPSGWSFMLDNSKVVAELVFNNAYLCKKDAYKVDGEITHLLTISGEGTLKIVARGESTLKAVGSVIATAMAGGTTYTSMNGGKLIINQSGSSNKSTLTETAGKLTFDKANLTMHSSSQNINYPFSFLYATSDMLISGGKLDMTANSYSAIGIHTGGDLTVEKLAIVNIKQACASADSYTGVSGRPTNPNYRYGVSVGGKFTVDGASVYIVDNSKNMFEYSANKMPVMSTTTKSYYSVNADGTDAKALNPSDSSAKIEHPYVAFVYDCDGIKGKHTYDSEVDRDCNLCGAVRDVPRDITIRIVADGGVKDEERNNDPKRPFKNGYCTEVTVRAKEVYYGTTDANGLVTSFTKTAPEKWTFKLDNTKPVAELTFNNAYMRKAGTYKDITSYDSNGNPKTTSTNLLTVSGEGKLKVITKGDTTLLSIYGHVMETRMVGGTTYSSENGAKLSLNQNGTSGYSALVETKGELNFVDAIIYANNNRNNPNYSDAIIEGTFDVNVSGGSIEIESINCSTEGLVVGGSLKLTNNAKIRLIGQKQKDNRYVANEKNPRYSVQVTGDITIDNSSMRIMDAVGNWDFAINKSPKLIDSTAKYSESAEGTDLKALNPADPTKPVDYPYVEYVANCSEHIWDNRADNECNRCGLIRAVPHSIQVAFQFGVTTLESLIWNAKVGEVYYATTTEDGFVVDLGKLDSEPDKWNIKLDNTGTEAVLTFKGATIIRKVNTLSANTVFDLHKRYQATVMAMGDGALRVVTEKASTIATEKKYNSIVTSMVGGTTFESKDNAKLTVTNNGKTTVFYGINELVGNLTFDHANILVQTKYSHSKNTYPTVSTPRNMTVIGGRVEINAAGKASIGLSVKGDLLVKDNAILLVSTTSKPGNGECQNPAYAIKADGNITVNDATLMVKNYGSFWDYLINKMPILVKAGSYSSATSTKESKLEAFTAEAGSDLTTLEAKKFIYFSNAKPGTLVDNIAGAVEEEEDDLEDIFFDDPNNPFAGDTVNLTLLFALTMSSAAALVFLFSKKRIFRK